MYWPSNLWTPKQFGLKKCGPKILLDQNLFGLKIFLDPKEYLSQQFFFSSLLTQILFDPKTVNPQLFVTKYYSGPNIVWNNICFNKFFNGDNVFPRPIFFDQNSFKTNFVYLKFCLTNKNSDKKLFSPTNGGSTTMLSQNNFGSKMILSPKRFWSKKILV